MPPRPFSRLTLLVVYEKLAPKTVLSVTAVSTPIARPPPRQSKEELFSIQNSRKARLGGYRGLQDPSFIAKKKAIRWKIS